MFVESLTMAPMKVGILLKTKPKKTKNQKKPPELSCLSLTHSKYQHEEEQNSFYSTLILSHL